MRKDPEDRKYSILDAALHLAESVGYNKVTKRAVATAAECSPSLVMHYFSTLNQLHRAIIGEAIRRQNLTVLAQGLVNNDSRVKNLPIDILQAVALNLIKP